MLDTQYTDTQDLLNRQALVHAWDIEGTQVVCSWSVQVVCCSKSLLM
jgi:hypothetical protein